MIRINPNTYNRLYELMVITVGKRGLTVDDLKLEIVEDEPENQLAIAVANVLLKQFEE